MSNKLISPSAILVSLTEQITQWRATRSSRRSPVPNALRQQTLDLLKTHSKSQVIGALGINHKMLKNWQRALHNDETIASSLTSAFVPLTISTPSGSSTLSPIELTLQCGSGEPVHMAWPSPPKTPCFWYPR